MAAGGRRSGLLFIILALVLIVILAAAAFFMRNQFFPAQRAQDVGTPIPSQTMVQIEVLAQPVTRGTVLSEAELKSIAYPQSEMIDGLFFTDPAKVVGKRAKFDLQPGMPLTPSMITDSQTGSAVSFQIPKGMVAISIPITRLTSVSYGLQPGDHVNILGAVTMVDLDTNFQSKLPNNASTVLDTGSTTSSGSGGATGPTSLSLTLGGSTGPDGRAEIDPTFNKPVYVIPSEPQRPRLVSQTMIQNAVVLYVGTFPLDANGQPATAPAPTAAPAANGAQTTPEAPAPPPDIISLVVTPQDAVTLNYLMLAGSGAKINLVLRSPGDDLKAQTEPVTLQFVMDQYNIPLPSKLPYGVDPAIIVAASTPTP